MISGNEFIHSHPKHKKRHSCYNPPRHANTKKKSRDERVSERLAFTIRSGTFLVSASTFVACETLESCTCFLAYVRDTFRVHFTPPKIIRTGIRGQDRPLLSVPGESHPRCVGEGGSLLALITMVDPARVFQFVGVRRTLDGGIYTQGRCRVHRRREMWSGGI